MAAGSETMTPDPGDPGDPADHEIPDLPEWEDEYVDRLAHRLVHNYDLEKDYAVGGRRFTLYGEMRMETQKHFLHPSISYANHHSTEHLFLSDVDHVRVADLEAFVDLGHDLADEWVEADEEHFNTDFTFAVVASSIPEDVREHVEGFSDRTLLRYGFHGHYEVNLLVATSGGEDVVASSNADVARAFAPAGSAEPERSGLLGRLVGRLTR